MSTVRKEWGVRTDAAEGYPVDYGWRPSREMALSMIAAMRAPEHPRWTCALVSRTVTTTDWAEEDV